MDDTAATIRTLVEDDIPQLLELRRTSFGQTATMDDEASVARQRARLPHSRGLELGGRLVATMTWFPFPAWIGGEEREVGALAAVMSLPEERRRGHVRRLLADGLRRLHERGVGWALEHPFDPRFYARAGFQSVTNGHRLRLPTRSLTRGRSRAAERNVQRIEAGDAVGMARIREIHAAFAAGRQFALTRAGDVGGVRPWQELLEPSETGRPVVAYLLADDGAYAIVELQGFGENGTLEVSDLGWTNGRGRSALLNFLGTFGGQLHHTTVHLPADDPLALDWTPWQHTSRPVLQARVVDLPAALAPLKLPPGSEPRSVVLELRDEACAWNTGWWRLELGPEGTRVSATTSAPQVATDPPGLVRLLTGASPAALLADGAVEGNAAAIAAVAQLAVERKPFLCRGDFF